MIDISIIVPMYNSEKTIERCIESVVAQTGCSWQVICVDDGSSDASAELARKYAENDQRIELVENPKNLGVATSRNIAMTKSVGKYIMNLDADDYLQPNCLEALVKYAEYRNVDMCFFKANFIFTDEKANRNIPRGIKNKYADTYSGETLFDIFLKNDEFFYYCALVFYKRAYLEKHNLRYKNLIVGEGGDFIIRALWHADRAAVYPTAIYNYCIHADSATNKKAYKVNILAGQLVQYVSMLEIIQNGYSEVAEKYLLKQRQLIAGGMAELEYGKRIDVREQMPSILAKMIFDTFIAYKDAYHVSFSEDDIRKLKEYRYVYIYGAGYAATECICRLSSLGVRICGIVVSKTVEERKVLYGHEVVSISEISTNSSQSLFVICANFKYRKEILAMLREHGFSSFIDLKIAI